MSSNFDFQEHHENVSEYFAAAGRTVTNKTGFVKKKKANPVTVKTVTAAAAVTVAASVVMALYVRCIPVEIGKDYANFAIDTLNSQEVSDLNYYLIKTDSSINKNNFQNFINSDLVEETGVIDVDDTRMTVQGLNPKTGYQLIFTYKDKNGALKLAGDFDFDTGPFKSPVAEKLKEIFHMEKDDDDDDDYESESEDESSSESESLPESSVSSSVEVPVLPPPPPPPPPVVPQPVPVPVPVPEPLPVVPSVPEVTSSEEEEEEEEESGHGGGGGGGGETTVPPSASESVSQETYNPPYINSVMFSSNAGGTISFEISVMHDERLTESPIKSVKGNIRHQKADGQVSFETFEVLAADLASGDLAQYIANIQTASPEKGEKLTITAIPVYNDGTAEAEGTSLTYDYAPACIDDSNAASLRVYKEAGKLKFELSNLLFVNYPGLPEGGTLEVGSISMNLTLGNEAPIVKEIPINSAVSSNPFVFTGVIDTTGMAEGEYTLGASAAVNASFNVDGMDIPSTGNANVDGSFVVGNPQRAFTADTSTKTFGNVEASITNIAPVTTTFAAGDTMVRTGDTVNVTVNLKNLSAQNIVSFKNLTFSDTNGTAIECTKVSPAEESTFLPTSQNTPTEAVYSFTVPEGISSIQIASADIRDAAEITCYDAPMLYSEVDGVLNYYEDPVYSYIIEESFINGVKYDDMQMDPPPMRFEFPLNAPSAPVSVKVSVSMTEFGMSAGPETFPGGYRLALYDQLPDGTAKVISPYADITFAHISNDTIAEHTFNFDLGPEGINKLCVVLLGPH